MVRSKFSTEPNRTEPPKKHRTEPNRIFGRFLTELGNIGSDNQSRDLNNCFGCLLVSDGIRTSRQSEDGDQDRYSRATLQSYSTPPYRELWWLRGVIFLPQTHATSYHKQEPTRSSKQPIRARYLGHVTGYQPIRDQYFLIRSVPDH
eukprot:sb/3473765/